MGSYAATECDLHAMDMYKKRPTERAATCEGNDIPNMNAKLIQIALHTMPSLDAGDTGEGSDGELG